MRQLEYGQKTMKIRLSFLKFQYEALAAEWDQMFATLLIIMSAIKVDLW